MSEVISVIFKIKEQGEMFLMSEDNPPITISYEGRMQFVAENSTDYRIPVESAVSIGGSGKFPNPVDYLITALGSCVFIVMIMGFSEKGFTPDFFFNED